MHKKQVSLSEETLFQINDFENFFKIETGNVYFSIIGKAGLNNRHRDAFLRLSAKHLKTRIPTDNLKHIQHNIRTLIKLMQKEVYEYIEKNPKTKNKSIVINYKFKRETLVFAITDSPVSVNIIELMKKCKINYTKENEKIDIHYDEEENIFDTFYYHVFG